MTWTAETMEEPIERWNLIVDGPALRTRTSTLQPVIDTGRPAMLKVATVDEEAAGAFTLAAWAGEGAARVLRIDEGAVVIERAGGTHDLTAMSEAGQDLESIDVLCRTARTLHGASTAAMRRLDEAARVPVGLRTWFQALAERAMNHAETTPKHAVTDLGSTDDDFLNHAWATADRLLDQSDPADQVLLHGDLHHGNVLEFTPGDWRAIDPKPITGDRAFDYTAMFGNPDLRTAAEPERFLDRVALVSARARIDRRTLLEWIVAWAGLSAAWYLEDDSATDAEAVIAVGRLAEAALWSSSGVRESTTVE